MGPPGIGKSALVRGFAASLGLDCVTLLGTQLAPEDLIGVPQLVGGRSRFAPPESIARDEPTGLSYHDIAGRVRVRGRGGTVLQPGISLLERAADFPADAPILVITDGECDAVRVRREHAFLVPPAARLPFTPRGPVFRMSGP